MEVKDLSGQAVPGSALVGKADTGSDWLGIPLVFRRGDSIPLQIGINTGVASLQEKILHLQLKQDCYLLFTLPDRELACYRRTTDPAARKKLLRQMRILASGDGKKWAPLSSWRHLKQVFGIRQGTISAGLEISPETGLTATLQLLTR